MRLGRLGIWFLILFLGTCFLTVCLTAGSFGYYLYEYSAGERRSLERAGTGTPAANAAGSFQPCREIVGTPPARVGRWIGDVGAAIQDITFIATTGNRRDRQFTPGDGAITAELALTFPRNVTGQPAQLDFRVYQPEGKIVTCRMVIIPKAGEVAYRVGIPSATPAPAESGRWRVEIVSNGIPMGSADFERR